MASYEEYGAAWDNFEQMPCEDELAKIEIQFVEELREQLFYPSMKNFLPVEPAPVSPIGIVYEPVQLDDNIINILEDEKGRQTALLVSSKDGFVMKVHPMYFLKTDEDPLICSCIVPVDPEYQSFSQCPPIILLVPDGPTKLQLERLPKVDLEVLNYEYLEGHHLQRFQTWKFACSPRGTTLRIKIGQYQGTVKILSGVKQL